MSIVSWRIANFGTLGSILGALGDHLAPFEEPGGSIDLESIFKWILGVGLGDHFGTPS